MSLPHSRPLSTLIPQNPFPSPDAPTFLSTPFVAADIDVASRVLAPPSAAADRAASSSSGLLEADTTLPIPITHAGTANGVLTWVEADLGAGGWVTAWPGGEWAGGDAAREACSTPSYGVCLHTIDGVWVAKVRKRERDGGVRCLCVSAPFFSTTPQPQQHSTLPLRVRRDTAQLTFTPASSPCRALRHARLPPWHWPMLADHSRALILARAAARAVSAACAAGVADPHVLEAGAGSGLLGILVARCV